MGGRPIHFEGLPPQVSQSVFVSFLPVTYFIALLIGSENNYWNRLTLVAAFPGSRMAPGMQPLTWRELRTLRNSPTGFMYLN